MKKYLFPIVALSVAASVVGCSNAKNEQNAADDAAVADSAQVAQTDSVAAPAVEVIDTVAAEPETPVIDEAAMKKTVVDYFNNLDKEPNYLTPALKAKHPNEIRNGLSLSMIGGSEGINEGTVKVKIIDAQKGIVQATAECSAWDEDGESTYTHTWRLVVVPIDGKYLIDSIKLIN